MSKTRILAPLLVLALAAGVAALLILTRPEVERQTETARPPLVRVVTVEKQSLPLSVRTQGNVGPRTASTLVAQVGGQVEHVASSFAEGAFFRRGQVLVRIDPRDYQLAVVQTEAQVARARVRLQQEEAEATVARQEWEELGDGEAAPLVLREPQLADARAVLEAAEAQLAQARLNLERTLVEAPFDGRVRRQNVDVGQFVPPGTPLGDVYATDVAEVRLPVSQKELAFLDLDLGTAAEPLPVELRGAIGGHAHSWRGEVVRSGSEIDPRTRMLTLFVEVEDPFRRRAGSQGSPLPMGLFVDAEIAGITVEHVVVLPRAALREGNRVLVVDEESRLRFRPVEVLRNLEEETILSSGLEGGEVVCVSPLDTVVDGMLVRTVPDSEVSREARG